MKNKDVLNNWFTLFEYWVTQCYTVLISHIFTILHIKILYKNVEC